MTFIRHLVRFDLQALMPAIAVWAGVLLLQSLVLWMGPPAPVEDAPVAVRLDVATIVMRFAMTAVLAALLVHSNPLAGTTAFWRTKPIRRASLLAAKTTSAFLLTVLLPFAWFTATFLLFGLDPATAAVGALSIAVEQTVVACGAFALAAVSTNLVQIVAGGVTAIVLFTASLDLISGPRQPMPFAVSVHGGEHIDAILLLALAAAFTLVAAHQYLTLKTWRSICLIAAVLASCLVILRYPLWRVVLPPVAERSPEVAAAPDLELDTASMRVERFVRLGSAGRTTGVSFDAALKDRGTPGALILKPVRTETTVSFVDGAARTFTNPLADGWMANYPDGTLADQPYASLQAALDGAVIQEPAHLAGRRYRVRFLEVPEDLYAVRLRQPATLDVSLELLAYHYAIATRLPLDDGARIGGEGSRITCEEASSAGAGVAVGIYEVSRRNWNAIEPTLYVLRNARRRQAVVAREVQTASYRTALLVSSALFVSRRRLEAHVSDRASRDVRLDDAWLESAELIVLKPEIAGPVSRSIHRDRFTLDPAFDAARDPAVKTEAR